MIENIVEKIINNFDFGYMLTINIMTYLINKVVDRIKEGKSSTLLKRIVLVISIISLTGIYLMVGYDDKIILVNSAIASPVFYSWVLKPIFKHFGIGYENSIN